ncbi:MAG: histidine phosphatase family protein [Acidobacteriota bacterium]
MKPTARSGGPSPSVRLFLIRHGITAANREMRFVGARDDPLTAEGHRQAEGIARMLSSVRLAALLSSPAARTRETAEPLRRAGDLPLGIDHRLREMSFGDWEGRRQDEITAAKGGLEALRRWQAKPESAPPGGGESFASVQRRLVELADELAQRHDGERIALITHVGPIKALLYAALGLPLTESGRLFLDPATVHVIDWSRRPTVRLINATPSLEDARWFTPDRG